MDYLEIINKILNSWDLNNSITDIGILDDVRNAMIEAYNEGLSNVRACIAQNSPYGE
jgi:hypothetical protein